MSEHPPLQVSSYGEKVISEQTISTSQSRSGHTKGTIPQSSSALTGFHALADLVLALTNADKDGRVLVVPSVGKGLDLWDGHLKFIMLNATKHFTEVSLVNIYGYARTVEPLLDVIQYKQMFTTCSSCDLLCHLLICSLSSSPYWYMSFDFSVSDHL